MLGIDFGTSFTSAALHDGSITRFVDLEYDKSVTPSAFFLKDDGDLLVGSDAILAGCAMPERLLLNMKLDLLNANEYYISDRRITTVQALTSLFKSIYDHVKVEMKEPEKAPVTLAVPVAYLAIDPDCSLYREAAESAGFDPLGITFISEPEAAAIGFLYGNAGRSWTEQILIVYDLGGGTFDAAAVRCGVSSPEILGCPIGDPTIGGSHFDRAILDAALIQADVSTRELYRRPDDLAALGEWRARSTQAIRTCREVKERLGVLREVPIVLPGFPAPAPTLSATALNELLTPHIELTTSYLSGLIDDLNDRGLNPSAILLVGGSCRLSIVPEILGSRLGLELVTPTDPARTVATGCAINAALRGRLAQRSSDRSRVVGSRDDPSAAFIGRREAKA